MDYSWQNCSVKSEPASTVDNSSNRNPAHSTPRDVVDNGRIRLGGTMRLPAARG